MDESIGPLSQIYHDIEERVENRLLKQQRRRQQHEKQEKQVEVRVVQQKPSQQLQDVLAENNSLKDYIEQLCEYINDTSGRYSRNVQKLSKEYEQLYLKLSDSQNRFDQEQLLAKNQLTAERDIKLAREQELARSREEIERLLHTVRQRQSKIEELKQQLQQKWGESQRQKELWSEVLNNLDKQQAVQSGEINELNQRLHQRNQQIESLQGKLTQLEGELVKRYSLPDKIQSCERKIVQDETAIGGLKEQLRRVEKELDVVRAELSRVNRERQQLKIKSVKYQQSFEVFFTGKIKQYEVNWQEERRQLSTTIARLKLQLEASALETQRLSTEMSTINEQLAHHQGNLSQAKKQAQTERQEKQSYLGEFRILKKNYENVIRTLEEGFKELQKKNWDLEEEKRDLEEEVDKFRELVKELANINDFATAGSSEYYVRQINKLQQTNPTRIKREDYVLAREQAHREVAAQRFNQGSKRVPKEQLNRFLDEEPDDSSEQWSKLIQGINSLKVSK